MALSSKMDSINKAIEELTRKFGVLEERVRKIEEKLAGLGEVKREMQGAIGSELEGIIRDLTRIEMALLAYKDFISGIQGRLEKALGDLSSIGIDVKNFEVKNLECLGEIRNLISGLMGKFDDMLRLLEELRIDVLSRFKELCDLIEGLKGIVNDVLSVKKA